MDIDAYMHDVRTRLATVATRLNESRTAALGPIHNKIAAATDELQQRRADLRQEKDAALSSLKEQAQQRRATASAEATRIMAEAKQRASQVRQDAKDGNEQDRQRVVDQYAQRLHTETGELEATIADLRRQESATRAEIGGELEESERQYSIEYDKVISEKLLTRKALANMGFSAPPRKDRSSKKGRVKSKNG